MIGAIALVSQAKSITISVRMSVFHEKTWLMAESRHFSALFPNGLSIASSTEIGPRDWIRTSYLLCLDHRCFIRHLITSLGLNW